MQDEIKKMGREEKERKIENKNVGDEGVGKRNKSELESQMKETLRSTANDSDVLLFALSTCKELWQVFPGNISSGLYGKPVSAAAPP